MKLSHAGRLFSADEISVTTSPSGSVTTPTRRPAAPVFCVPPAEASAAVSIVDGPSLAPVIMTVRDCDALRLPSLALKL